MGERREQYRHTHVHQGDTRGRQDNDTEGSHEARESVHLRLHRGNVTQTIHTPEPHVTRESRNRHRRKHPPQQIGTVGCAHALVERHTRRGHQPIDRGT